MNNIQQSNLNKYHDVMMEIAKDYGQLISQILELHKTGKVTTHDVVALEAIRDVTKEAVTYYKDRLS